MTEDTSQRKAILSAIIDSSDDAIISKDLRSIVTSWNKASERIFGYTEREMIGRPINILIPSDRQQEEDMIMSKLRKGERIDHYETIRVTKGGRQLNISITVSPIKNDDGVIVGASKIARDITRQKEQEEIIRQYSDRLEIINSVSKAISTQLDVTTILQKVTDATTHLSGAQFGAFFYNKTDSEGEAYTLFAISGASREAFEKLGMPRNTAVFSKTFNGEGILRSDDITKDPRYGNNSPHKGMPEGHLPVVSYMAVPVVSQSGVVIGGLFFGHSQPAMFNHEHEDLVGAIAAQAAITLDNAKLYEEVQVLNSKKDEFIGFASHELKTPLTTISGYLQLAERMPESFKDFLPKLRHQVDRLSGIIADLLDISKIQAGKLGLNYASISLRTLIAESIEVVNPEKYLLKIAIPEEDVLMLIDGQKMSQVLINILSNAMKYSPAGSSILLEAGVIGDELKISVSDEGMGIAADQLEVIFNQFYRVSESRHSAKGSGLGLYISRAIVEGHMGKIWAENRPQKGTVFHVVFPLKKMRGKN